MRMTLFVNDTTLPWPSPPIQQLVVSAFRLVRFVALATTSILMASVLAIGGERARETLWRLQEGSPSKTITAVIQSKEGYIWAGTYEGLVRYDGVTYTLLN